MTIPTIQTAMNAGELSPAIFGRVDLEKFKRGLSTCRNFYAWYRGPAISRAGLAFVGQCRQGNQNAANLVPPPRNISFQFSVTEGIVIEAGQNYFRFISQGAYITDNPTTITNVTQANPAVVTDPAHGYSTGDEVFISEINGMTRLDGLSFIVVVQSANTYTLLSPLTGALIDSLTYSPYISGGTAQRIYTLGTPYAASDLPALKFTQSADVMSLTHPSYPPYDLARIASNDWTLTKTTFIASILPPGYISLAETDSGLSTKSFYYQFVATAVDGVTGEESIASPVGTILAVDMAAEAASIYMVCGTQPGAGSYNFYGAIESYTTTASPNIPAAGASFGFIGRSLGNSFTDTNITPDFDTSPPTHNNPFATSSVIEVNVTAGGANYHQLTTTATVFSPTGDNPQLMPVVSGGAISWVAINYAGSGLSGGEAVNFSDTTSPGTQATGFITFTINPSAGDTITLGGVVWTFATASASYQTVIQGSLGGTLGLLATNLNASVDPVVDQCGYSADATHLYLQYKTPGTGGNGFALAASVATPSGAFLTGGTGVATGSGAAATLVVGPATGTFPSVVAYFQQRRFYANSYNQPDTYWASQPGAFTNFDTSLPTVDSDAITGSPWSQQVNGIQWMLNMPGGLVIFTGLGAWQLSGGGGGLASATAITPSSQVANPQAYNGCSPTVPPIAINYDILYVQEKGSIVRDLSYNFFANIYTGTDMTVLSNHLFDNHLILQWAWCEEPNKLIWAVRDDGILLCLTYLKEQDVYAWSRHDTNGLFQSVCSVSEPPVNAPYFVVKRLIQTDTEPVWAYFQERMDNRLWNNQDDSFCVDAGLSYPQNMPDATLNVTSAAGVPTLTQPNLIYGGKNYSSTSYVELTDPTGTGAVPFIEIAAGVVTVASVGGILQGYTAPVFKVIDPTGLGGGAVIAISSVNVTTAYTSSGVFANAPGQGEAGDVIYMGGREMVVAEYNSPTQIICEVLQANEPTMPNDPLNTPLPATSGNWSIVAPTNFVQGLDHLEGMLVSILADGVVVQPQIVSNGSVTLPQPATKIVVGLGFVAQLQSMYLEIPGGITVQGRRKEIDSVVVRVDQTATPFEIGVNQPDASRQPGGKTVPWTNMTGIQGAVTGSGMPLQPYDFTSDDLFQNVYDQLGITGGQIAIQQTRPIPLSILALMPSSRIMDDAEQS